MQTLARPIGPVLDGIVELNLSVLKVDVSQVITARNALLAAGLRTAVVPKLWPGSRTRQLAIQWGNHSPAEKLADIAAGKAALEAAGFEVA